MVRKNALIAAAHSSAGKEFETVKFTPDTSAIDTSDRNEVCVKKAGTTGQKMMEQSLIDNIDRVHTTAMGEERIRRNLGLGETDVVTWCKDKILKTDAEIERRGKNWYVHIDGCVITVNASSYTIITCHKE